MKNLLIFFLVWISIAVSAQSITINWQDAKSIEKTDQSSIVLPFFSNKEYGIENNIPVFNYNVETSSNHALKIQNIVFSNLSASEKGSIDIKKIPTELQYDVKVNKGMGRFYNSLSLIPFVREGNQIKKVVSFEIIEESGKVELNQPMGILDPATQSVLKTGSWYKIKIKKSGIFRLDKSFFDQNGIPTNFDPRTLKIYGNGGRMLNENPGEFRYGDLQENAIQVTGEQDGSFDSGDFILFYAQGPHDWYRQNNSSMIQLTHRTNVYSDEAYYFITFDGTNGKRVQDVEISGNPVETFNQYEEYIFYENDSINLNQQGKQWGGESFNLEPSQDFTLTGNAPAISGAPAFAKFRLIAKQGQNVNYSCTINGNSLGSGTFPTNAQQEDNQFQVGDGVQPVNLSGNSFTFNVNVNSTNNPGSFIFLDYLEVKYTANLSFNGTQMQFRRLRNLNDGNLYGFALSGPQKVWNISDITNASNVLNSGGVYKYQSNSPLFLNEMIAFNESAAYTEIEYAGTVSNQNLHGITGIEYLVITHPNYLGEASRLANFRIQNDHLKATVVTVDQIYNEFSSGNQDVNAIRDFIKHLRDHDNPVNYVLIMGGASYDYKDRIQNNTNYVPTYISFASNNLNNSYATDDFFTMIDESDIINENTTAPYDYRISASSQMDTSIGRMPANDLQEAKTMVDKTLAYYEKLPGQGTSFGDWKTKFYLIVDDDLSGDTSGIPFHNKIEETSAQYIEQNIPYATLRKGYLDAFVEEGSSGGPRYPQVNQLINNAFNLGSALLVYFGHGGPRSWAQERIITYEEINDFSNFTGLYSRLPVVLTITCEFTVWDIPELPSAGVYMFKSPEGGTAAMVTTSRPVFVSYGLGFNEPIMEQILKIEGKKYQSLGPALTHAKVNGSNSSNNYSVNLLGDPYLSVTKPPRDIRITKINGQDADTFDGLLRAMDFVTIEGEVLSEDGASRDFSFNGKANATLFDKPVLKTTLNNNNWNSGATPQTMSFQEQINAIFKGGTNVSNGGFKFQFYVPKDINYEVGEGKLTVYAHNNATDAVTTKKVKIGDQNPDGLNDDNGPTIGLYMNNLNFVNGGITDRDPYLLACLIDSTGINTSGIAIGHDITGILDTNVEGTYVLNEYYEGGDNNPCTNPQVLDYQKGQVMYRINNLELGNHQIHFKAWDINNNSSEETLDFVVMEDGADHIYIEKLLNWPNPFTNQTYFHFEHNCDAELDVMVQVFTISGKLVKTIRQTVTAEPWREGYRTGRFAIPWDGLDDFGDKIGKGVYIYRVTARGVNPDVCKGSATAIEKLVILK